VLSADHLHPHAYTRVGHKGLIFDRLDVGVADRGDNGTFTAGQFVGHPACDFDTPRIVPFARGLYHNRNRVYMPELGRFAQADPNASGQTLLDLPVYHGRRFTSAAVLFDLRARYGDGGSLYAYMGGNPWLRGDPMGLSWDPFDDMVMDYLAADIGQRHAALDTLGRALGIAKGSLNSTRRSAIPTWKAQAFNSIIWNVLSSSGVPVLSQMGDVMLLASGEIGWGEFALNFAAGLAPAGKYVLGGAKLTAFAIKAGAAYAAAAPVVGWVIKKDEFHHFFPRQYWDDFERLGFTPDELDNAGMMLTREHRKAIHGKGFGLEDAWNDKWYQWLRANKTRSITKQDAIRYLQHMFDQFGLGYAL
jgi:hypothetical protein